MPVTCGDARVPLEKIDYAIESDSPLVVYDTGTPTRNDTKIVDFVLSLVPDNATVQFGVGAIPDRVLAGLADISGASLFSGMLSQSLVHFLEHANNNVVAVNGELAGDQDLYDYCHQNERVFMAPLSKTHNFSELTLLERFVSINSAVEIDLQGQSNGETLGSVQISGVGGSLDYIQAALLCEGGVSILAMPSATSGEKKSKIVTHLAHGSAVTTPRYCVDYVVTEYGIASLRGKTLWQRAEELISIAHPKFRNSLVADFENQTNP
jgi:4-hydroxybutyrate CoA-transferase